LKLKKAAAFSLAVLLTISCLPVSASALTNDEVNAPSAVLVEANTGKTLFEKNPHEKRCCASITKVMTLLLVMEAIDSGKIGLDDTVTASDHASSMGGSQIWLKSGETMTVDDMLKATVIASANDTATALAEYVAGSEDEFVKQMNEKAKKLQMNDTTFKNCNGLDEDGHLTSANDVAIMSRELIKHDKIFKYTKVWIDYLRGGKTQLVNTNKLVKYYDGITGLKTGTTGKAGSCISATAERNGVSLIAVVLGSSNTKDRFAAARTLLDYGFANWEVAEPAVPETARLPVSVSNGMEPQVQTDVTKSGSILVPKGRAKDVKSSVTTDKNVKAPVKKGQSVGKVVFTLDGKTLKEYGICAKNDVAEITFRASFGLLFKSLINMGA